MSSTHSSILSRPRSVIGGALSKLQAGAERLKSQVTGAFQKQIQSAISPARETAGISNPDAALSNLPLGILGVPGPEYSLRRSARLAAKASEQQVYATDPDFWAIDERTDKRDLNPELAAETRLHLSQQSRTSPFDDVEVANSTREAWGVTIGTSLSGVRTKDVARAEAVSDTRFNGARPKELVLADVVDRVENKTFHEAQNRSNSRTQVVMTENTDDRHTMVYDALRRELASATDKILTQTRSMIESKKSDDNRMLADEHRPKLTINNSPRSEHRVLMGNLRGNYDPNEGGLVHITPWEVDQSRLALLPASMPRHAAATVDDEPFNRHVFRNETKLSDNTRRKQVENWLSSSEPAENVPPVSSHQPLMNCGNRHPEPSNQTFLDSAQIQQSHNPMANYHFVERPTVLRHCAKTERRQNDVHPTQEPDERRRPPTREPSTDDAADEKKKPDDNAKPELSCGKPAASTVPTKAKQWLKMGSFDGRTEVEAFIKRFTMSARNNGWDDYEKLSHLSCALKPPADQLLWEAGADDVTTWSDLVQRLRDRYGSQGQSALHQTQLSLRKQSDHESISDLVQDIRRLMTLAFPGPTTSHSEAIAVRSFLDALADKTISRQTRDKEPKTLDEAFKIAMRLEGYRRADADSEERSERRNGKVRATTEAESELETLRRRVEQMEQMANRPPRPPRPRYPAAYWPPQPPTYPNNQFSGTNAYDNRPQQLTGNDRRCYECQAPDHFARNCPMRAGATNYQPGPTEAPDVGRAFHIKGSNCAYLPVQIYGRQRMALLDSGSNMSLAPATFVRPEDITDSDQLIYAANGTAIRVLGEATLRCRIADMEIEAKCLVTRQITELILGLDWLERQDVHWSFGGRWVDIRGRTLPIYDQSKTGQCRRVIAVRDVKIPAWSEMDVETYAVLPNLKTSATQWATRSKLLPSGLVVAGTLLPQRAFDLAVRVMNPTDREIHFSKGTQCTLEPVTLINQSTVDPSAAHCSMVSEITQKSDLEEAETILRPLWTEADSEVPQASRDRLKAVLLRHRDAFSLGEWDLGFTDRLQHRIDTGDERPVRQPLRRQPLSLLPVIDEQVQQMLVQGLIEPSASEWSSNVVIVRKKDGTPRFCVDYRAVNAITRKDAYPLPLISESLDALSGAKWFSTFDLRAGYHQVAVHPADRHKTGFVTRRGSFQFRVLPFGMCNSPATFSRMMNLVMAGLSFEICLIYLDDIIIFAEDLETHFERLEIVLQRLQDANLKLKPSKCKLLQRQVLFLGHLVSEHGVTTDPAKIQAVEEWPTPTKVKDVRAFLGLSSYYRRFVPNFAQTARPLHATTRKGQKFEWTELCETAFQALKRSLIEAPILALPNDLDRYILDTDASGESIGAVLSQIQDSTERVICYGSRVCSPAERNYDVTRRELLAIVFFLKTFRPYLLGRKFLLRTDHSALQWLRKTPVLIGQQARWLSVIEEFDFDIQHRSGSAHQNADAMSRRPLQVNAIRENRTAVTTHADLPSDWVIETLVEEQHKDPNLAWVINKKMESDTAPPPDELRGLSSCVKRLVSQWPQLVLHDGLLKRQWISTGDREGHRLQLIPPPERRTILIRLAHEGLTGGHLGIRRTLAQLQLRAYWPGWKEDVELQLKRCVECAQYMRSKPPHQGPLQTFLVGEPMECLGIDVTGPHPTSTKGHKYILTVIDHFSRWAEAYPIRNQESLTVASTLLDQWISRYGCPKQILTDQGPCFEAALFRDLCRLLQIDKVRTSPYKPSTNGAIERFHRTLNALLGKSVAQNQKDWSNHVPWVMMAYRASRHEGTGFSPNRLFLGRETCLPIDLVLGECNPNESRTTAVEYVAKQVGQMQHLFQLARDYMQKLAVHRAIRYDLRVKPARFHVNQWVWYYYPRKRPGIKDKWAKWFTGPYKIIQQVGPVLYKIQKSPRSQPLLVYVDKLKAYAGEPPKDWTVPEVDILGGVSPVEFGEESEDLETPTRPRRNARRPARYE